MPQSKSRKPAPHHVDFVPHKKKKKSAVPVAIVFCALIALGIAWFAETSVTTLIIAAIIGAVIGFFSGKQMDNTFNKK